MAYSKNQTIKFNQEEKIDLNKYKYSDKYEKERGKYALSQTLDYNSLQYSESMDYEIEIDGQTFVPGGDREKMKLRHEGKHGATDWVWRWSKEAVEWGKKNDFFVIKNDRIYTKSYLYCRKKNGKCEIEKIEATKAFTTLSYLENKYSNDNGKKELDSIFIDGNSLFKNPKPQALISTAINMVTPDKEDALILDFFAGSGTTGHAVLDLNKSDNQKRTFILCQLNEKTDTTSNGIAYDVTSKRLKRIMTGSCYDDTNNFPWLKDNEPYGGNLDVYEIAEVANFESAEGKTPFEVIDETLYGKEKISTVKEKIDWVCQNFEKAQKKLE